MDCQKEETGIARSGETKAWQAGLFAAIDGFAAVQQDQLQKLADGNLKDLMSWRHGRQKAFDRLKQYLDLLEVNSGNGDAAGFLSMVQEKMQTILENENTLNNAARAQREKIAGQLSALRKGKKAVQGYRLYGPASRPKYLSSKA